MTNCDYKRLLACFVRLDLRAKYVGSVLGLLWTVAQPLALLLIYTFVFSQVLGVAVPAGQGTAYYSLYLLAGLLPWHAFQRGVMRSSTSLVESGGLIKKVAFPINILPVYMTLSELLSECVGFLLLIGALVLFDPPLHGTLLLLPLVMVMQLLFTVGLGWIVACGNAYFRDVSQFTGLLLMAWFFATPILYPMERVPDGFPRTLLQLNPMTHLVEIYRAILLRGELPPVASLSIFTGFMAVSFGAGYALFKRNEKLLPDLV